MTRSWLGIATLGAALPFAAFAYPEGAPWPHGKTSEAKCSSCHFDIPPIKDSQAIKIEGLDGELRVGQTYGIAVRFSPDSGKIAGFLAYFEGLTDDAGELRSLKDTEARGDAVRSTAVQKISETPAVWNFHWTAPTMPGPVTMHIAANAANDDASPFGDEVHYRILALDVR